MDSVVQVALIGGAVTAITSVAGVVATLRAAGIHARGEADLEELKSRRATYGACVAALLRQRDANLRLMHDILDGEEPDEGRAREGVEQARALHDNAGSVVGAVVVEGPQEVASRATDAAHHLGAWLDELAWWFDLGRPHHQRRALMELRDRAQDKLDEFGEVCRRALHPDEDKSPRWGLWRRWTYRRRVLKRGWKGWH